MKYELGKSYDFWVTGIRDRRIMLRNAQNETFSVSAYDYQADWDWSSPKVPVSMMRCYVNKVWDGGLSLQQDKEVILSYLYPEAKNEEAKMHTFVVEELKTINDTLFLVVRDAFGLNHLFKPSKTQESLQPGDELELMVTGIVVKEQNKSRLKLESVDRVKIETKVVDKQPDFDNPVGEFGEEGDKREFKSTIAYPAGATEIDIDTQMKVILRTIAGFQNAQGGTLYIGVNDNGNPIGIENEFALLNLSENDDPNKYKEDVDGYQNKLRSCIQRHLGHVAEDYVTINFLRRGKHTVCEVECQPSDFIIWYDGFMPYKRMGNRTILLRQEAIVKLIFDKSGYSRPENMKYKPTKAKDADGDGLPDDDTPDIITSKVPSDEKIEQVKLQPLGMQKEGRGSYYINLFKNGEWSWSKERPTDKNLEYCLPINAPAREKNVVLVYADGRVNKVNANSLHKRQENRKYQNGRRNDGVKLAKAFSATDHDLLACFSEKDGHEWVKAHYLSHISAHDTLLPMGNVVINTKDANTEMKDIGFVSARHGHRVSALMKTENQTSSSLGFQIDDPENKKLEFAVQNLRAVSDVI